ncbi:MAG: carboxypeptidase regulatory-like domain-containing protein [bacterium]|nr:carboxypeptidase regulatory-like domain-containing protein [bacterium]
MRRLLLLAAAGWLLAVPAPALADGLKGQVRDLDSKSELIGADVVLLGTDHRTATDIKGRFEFPDLLPGTYELRATYTGYNPRTITNVRVVPGPAAEIMVELEGTRAYETDEMVVSGTRVLSTDSALMLSRQQAGVIGDAISAAQISRSPDGNSGDALKRVPGLTVNDGKYVFVRGIGDRYNVTEVNGVQMSGTNVDRDRKSFNFDMVPANLLSNITVIKQATPDLPGDFSGGLVRISTLEFPEGPTTAAGYTIGAISGATGSTLQYDAIRGDTDWLGIDDGGRDFPDALRDSTVTYQNLSLRNPYLARALPNRWTTEGRPAPPRMSFNLSHGNKVRLLGVDVGFMGAASYGDKADIEDENEVRIGGNSIIAGGTTHHTQTTLGGLANIFLRWGRQRIGFTNLYNRTTDSQITFMSGKDQKTFEWRTMSWHERYQFVDKIDGSHHLPGPGGGFDLDWQVSYGESHATEPDRRYLAYNLDFEPKAMDENMRTWTWLDEIRRGQGMDLAWSPTNDDLARENNLQVKAGFKRDQRSRTFDSESWYTLRSQSNRFDGALAFLPPDSIFRPENYNEVSDPRRGTKWEFVQDTVLSGTYVGNHEIDAWYAMVDLPFSVRQEVMRLTGGARVEDSDQVVYSVQNKLFPDVQDTSRIDKRDVLPSVALTWMYDEDTNVRVGYYKSVNRPEFRELAPVLRRDYRTFENQRGNPNLKRAQIHNYDVRVEHFPAPGQVRGRQRVLQADVRRHRGHAADGRSRAPDRHVHQHAGGPQLGLRGGGGPQAGPVRRDAPRDLLGQLHARLVGGHLRQPAHAGRGRTGQAPAAGPGALVGEPRPAMGKPGNPYEPGHPGQSGGTSSRQAVREHVRLRLPRAAHAAGPGRDAAAAQVAEVAETEARRDRHPGQAHDQDQQHRSGRAVHVLGCVGIDGLFAVGLGEVLAFVNRILT